MICSSVFLLTGILDDKYNLSPYTKFLTLTIILLVFFFFTEILIQHSNLNIEHCLYRVYYRENRLLTCSFQPILPSTPGTK